MMDNYSIKNQLNSYQYPSKITLGKDRVKCSWTQHEMPARVDAIEKYVQGKKYQQLLKKKIG